MAQLHELNLEDIWDTLEVISIDAHNRRILVKLAEDKKK